MRGASALQEALRDSPDAAIRVLVVWEPVIATDLGPPPPWVLSEVRDVRAAQFWDRRRVLSDALSAGAKSDPSGPLSAASKEIGPVIWDYIAFFPPGVKWETSAPSPTTWYFPVVHHMDEVRADLAAAGDGRR